MLEFQGRSCRGKLPIQLAFCAMVLKGGEPLDSEDIQMKRVFTSNHPHHYRLIKKFRSHLKEDEAFKARIIRIGKHHNFVLLLELSGN